MEDQRVDPIGLFPEEMRQGAQDLAYLGYKQRIVEFCGHTFVLETIRPYLRYTIGQVIEPYRNTLKEPDAWAAVHVGVALASIDSNASFCPPVNDSPRDFVQARFNWLTGPSGYWQPVIDYLFAQYVELEQETSETIAELHRFAERSRESSLPSPASSTDRGPSSEPTAGDTLPTEPSS